MRLFKKVFHCVRGVASPILANIALHELDVYVEDVLIPKYTKGKKRKNHPRNNRLRVKANYERKRGNYTKAKEIQRIYTNLPTQLYEDPDYRRLRYIRYADDTLFGLAGTKAEAEAIKAELSGVVQESIELELSDEKTVITHATHQRARFLNYEIGILRDDRKRTKTMRAGVRTRVRSINGTIVFYVPKDIIQEGKARITRGKKICHRAELTNLSEYDIITKYEVELQGLINYYILAQNVAKEMYKLRYYYRLSLVKTLAAKLKTRASKIRQKYTRYMADGRKVIAVEIQREGKKPLRAIFGRKPIHRKTSVNTIQDKLVSIYTKRNELITRLLAETCELCGNKTDVEGHHIRKLKDLKTRWKGRKEKPAWVKRMIALNRKSLFVCEECHQKIHNGTYDGRNLPQA